MLKKLVKSKLFWGLCFFPLVLDLLISINNHTLGEFEFQRYSNKFLLILKMNISYYASVVGFGLAYLRFLSDEQQRVEFIKKSQEELNQQRAKENEMKEKELMNYLDKYRPSFLEENGMLVLLMRDDNYYLRNICFYEGPRSKAFLHKDQQSGYKIHLNGVTNNYFITAETLLGEKIIFGKILNNVHIYKALKEGCSPIPPNTPGKYKDSEFEQISNNWIPFNTMKINENSTLKDFDKIFMNRTTDVRANMGLNATEFKKSLASVVDIKTLFNNALEYILANKKTYSVKIRIAVLDKVIEILNIHQFGITINLRQINEASRNYIKNNNINIDRFLKKDTESAYEVFQYIKNNNLNLDNIIRVFVHLLQFLEVDTRVDIPLIDYTDCILQILEK